MLVAIRLYYNSNANIFKGHVDVSNITTSAGGCLYSYSSPRLPNKDVFHCSIWLHQTSRCQWIFQHREQLSAKKIVKSLASCPFKHITRTQSTKTFLLYGLNQMDRKSKFDSGWVHWLCDIIQSILSQTPLFLSLICNASIQKYAAAHINHRKGTSHLTTDRTMRLGSIMLVDVLSYAMPYWPHPLLMAIASLPKTDTGILYQDILAWICIAKAQWSTFRRNF